MADRAKILAAKKRYRDKNKAKISKYNKEYRATHAPPSKERRKTYRKSVSRVPIVYAYFKQGVCFYVGRGSMSRAKGHKYTSSWWSADLLLVTRTCKDEWEAMEYEGKWGGRYRPLYNKEGYRYN